MEQAVTVEEVIHRNDIVFIDVRSPKEFTGASIPGAVNIPCLITPNAKSSG